MSLINDALKRAQSDKPRPSESQAAVPPLQPAESAAPSSSAILPWAVLFLGCGVLAVAAVLWFRGNTTTTTLSQNTASQPSQQPQGNGEAIPAVAETTVLPEQAPAPASTQTEVVPPAPVQTPASTPQTTAVAAAPESRAAAPASTSASTEPQVTETQAKAPEPVASTAANLPAVQPTIAAPPSTPSATESRPRLQAIYYRLKGPTVVINGKTYRVGQSAGGIRVVSIQRTSVEIEQNGKYRTLTLQD